MPRRMVISAADRTRHLLLEALAENEAQLQELVKDNPDLLPIEEFGLTGPLMVVGRETVLPSGGVDLVALTLNGNLLVVEFKTGPQNTDFRRVLAQLLDYGSDMWRMSFDEFEQTVAVRYFTGSHCREPRTKEKHSLEDAARAIWTEIDDEGFIALRDRLTQRLKSGDFDYIVVSQRFTSTVERTVEYLNATMSLGRFYAVELVRFVGDSFEAFESRTVLKPSAPVTPTTGPAQSEARFLSEIEDEPYRQTLRDLFDMLSGLQLKFEWGSVGTSIRMSTPDRPEPLTIAWLFPPARVGWMGLTDLTLGYDNTSAEKVPSIREALNEYAERTKEIPNSVAAKPLWLTGRRLAPEVVIEQRRWIGEIIAQLVRRVSGNV